jgi:zinc/manganese transport system permease protein
MPQLLELRWMLIPFLACLVLSINHVYLGIHVIARKVIFVDLALAQIAALGATYALTLGYDPNADAFRISLFSLAFTFVGAGAFAVARMRRERVPQEAFIGIIYAAASAAAILILSKSATGGEELKHMLVGDVLLVQMPEVINMAIGYGIIGLFHVVFRRKFLAISLDPEAAEASGIRIRFWDVLFYMSFGVVITKSVAIVGVLLVFSYLVVPAVIAQMWSDSIRGRLLFGWVVAILASTLGIAWSFYSDYPTGPAIVVMLAVFLIGSSVSYYVRHAPGQIRALANVAAMVVFGVAFLYGLAYFKKSAPVTAAVKQDVIEMLMTELNGDEEAHQLDAIRHLGSMQDPRIVPALANVVKNSKSDQVVEAAVTALTKQKDPRAVPALRGAAQTTYDSFLELTIGKAQLSLGDTEGFATLIKIMKDDEAGFARQQASELLDNTSGRKWGYNAERSVAENAPVLKNIAEWYTREGSKMKLPAAK